MPALSAQIAEPIAISTRLAESRGSDKDSWEALAGLPVRSLGSGLKSDAQKLAFWLNLYNAAVQARLRERPERYRHRGWFFARPSVRVAGKRLSLNAIEHGLLRRSMFGYSMGYVANPFPSRFERRFRVEQRDPRVHFALNCGARSCPPVSVYDPARIDEGLEQATHSYLLSESDFDAETATVRVPRLLLWFRGDFGGTAGTLTLLRRHGVVPKGVDVRIKHQPYDWTLTLAD